MAALKVSDDFFVIKNDDLGTRGLSTKPGNTNQNEEIEVQRDSFSMPSSQKEISTFNQNKQLKENVFLMFIQYRGAH